MFKLLRYYAIASLACVVLAAIVLTALYRTVSLEAVVRMAERGNLALGQALSNSVRGQLVDYIAGVADTSTEALRARELPQDIARAIHDVMRDTSVVKVKIYNRRGSVVFSTQASEIGSDQSDNPGFSAAIGGKPVSEIVYRDTFNRFDRATEDDNLLQTYIPIRIGPADRVHGVFEIYTDVNPLVAQNERTLFLILGGAALVLTLLYGALLLVVRRANGMIEAQERIIRERTDRLEALTAQLLKNDEAQRKSLALELHEGLAQTLSTIKLKVEMAARAAAPGSSSAGPDAAADSIVPLLQAAIEETRTLASGLRPSSLDDFGLLPTIAWLCREVRAQHPAIRIEQHISIDEERVVAPLKLVIFRILEAALRTVASDANADRIELALTGNEGAIVLTIDEATLSTATVGDAQQAEPAGRFADLHERALQSGGSFTTARNASGGVTLRASWPG
jgi:signal transduction histidine kinase